MIFFVRIIVIFFLLSSCQRNYQSQIVNAKNSMLTDFSIAANRSVVHNEELKIDSLLNLSNHEFITDTTGIRLNITKKIINGNSIFPKNGDIVTIAYDCILFDNIIDLSFNNITDTMNFKLGYSKQMRGLNYAIKLLQVGDKAKIIIPSYLGFGMSGYGKTVPPYSTLLLNVKLLNIKS